VESQTQKDLFQASNDIVVNPESEPAIILCFHYLRAAKNRIKCKKFVLPMIIIRTINTTRNNQFSVKQ
jgi:hypothetical protein